MYIFTLIESLKKEGIFIEVDELHNPSKLFKVVSHPFKNHFLKFESQFYEDTIQCPYVVGRSEVSTLVKDLNASLDATRNMYISGTGKSVFRLISDIYDEMGLKLTLNPVKNHEIPTPECVNTNIVPILDAYFGKNMGSEFAKFFSTNSNTLYEIRLTKTRPTINPDFAFNGSECSIPFSINDEKDIFTNNQPKVESKKSNVLPLSVQALLLLADEAQHDGFDKFYLVYKIIKTDFFKLNKIKKYLVEHNISIKEWELEFLKLAQKLYNSKITVDEFSTRFSQIEIVYTM